MPDWHDINTLGFRLGGKVETDEEELERLLRTPGTSEQAAAFEKEYNQELAQKGTSGGFALHSLTWRHADESNKSKTDARNGDTIRLLCGVDGCMNGTAVRFELYAQTPDGGRAQFQDASSTLENDTAAVDVVLDLSKVKADSEFTVYFTVTAKGKYSSNCTIPIGKDPLKVKKCDGPSSAEPGTKAVYKVTELNRKVYGEELRSINWIVKAGDHIHRNEKNVGPEYILDIPGTHAGSALTIHPYIIDPSDGVKVETKIGPFLQFNGSTLALFDMGHKKIAEWSGVSGEGGGNDPMQPDGPIPEGRWMVKQSELQKLPGLLSGEPNWEGGESAWGKERVQIYPFGTKTHGRSRFYIHGGKKAGSKFGIDLTDKIDDFLRALRKLGKDVVLIVKLKTTIVNADRPIVKSQVDADKILSLCEKHWDEFQKDCSGFAKAVAREINVELTGQANDIVDQIQSAPWKKLQSGQEAEKEARSGKFVMAGLKASNHGHVAIIVPGDLAHGKYPTAYWGSIAGLGRKNKTINYSWSVTDRDKVIYASLQVR